MTKKQVFNIVSKPVGLGTQVAESLTQAILEGLFKGGDQLVEQELQSQFGVSRSPLREAFRELEKKGLVDILPRRGTFVKRISRKDIEDHFPVRAALEGLAAQLAAENMTRDTLTQMKSELEKMQKAAEERATVTYYRHHLLFHELFINCSNNDLLIETLKTLRTQNLWHCFSYKYYQEQLENSLFVHFEIYEHFKASSKNTAALRLLVEQHINVALERFLAYLEAQERH